MPFAWIRPAEASVLDGRPLLDVGCGDAQTLAALVTEGGLVAAIDRSLTALRAARRVVSTPLVAGEAERLPFGDSSFAVALAADLFHHLDDAGLEVVLREIHRVLSPDGRLVAWWYAEPGRPGPDTPRFPRPYDAVAPVAERAGYATRPLELVATIGFPIEAAGMAAQALP